jgi:hypothetical protein
VAEATEHPKILRAKSGMEQYCSDEAIDELIQMAQNGADAKGLRVLLRRLVPDFTERIAIMSSDGNPQERHPRASGALRAITDNAGDVLSEIKRRASGAHKPILD